ncbi:hypothetical protein SAMN05216167_101299 [Spirosoma endophyticum]|uniref:YTH domain-containing protein n=1 Tax=Spirosoma endophyticum TaxID=662367 RepID=A0A1I1FZD7_9BACT|nr:hypothetical protein SAMN05216167_101299 [Spirosoma endophyticum]
MEFIVFPVGEDRIKVRVRTDVWFSTNLFILVLSLSTNKVTSFTKVFIPFELTRT